MTEFKEELRFLNEVQGTTAIACKELQRNFIGFEISKEYCNIANQRLDKWKGQKRLF